MQVKTGIKTKLNKADGLRFPTEHIPVNRSPSILFVTKTAIAKIAGTPHAKTWKYDAKPSIDS